jgi:hypothetical protein
LKKKPVRGEYSDECFVVGYLIDKEFNMAHDAFADKCLAGQLASSGLLSDSPDTRRFALSTLCK